MVPLLWFSLAQAEGLVGHWKFDDAKDSAAAADASGNKNDGKLAGGPKWVEGKFGGALEFDGKAAVVEIPDSKVLENLQEGDYTLATWFKAADAPPGTDDDANDSHYTIVGKTGWHLGLVYNREKQFTMEHWEVTDKPEEPAWAGAGSWDDEFEPGEWRHVVAVVDRTAREVKLYVDGELRGTSEGWPGGSKSYDYEQSTWKIGCADPGAKQWAYPAKGAIDDVRLYSRALKGAEIEGLFKAKP